MKNRKASTFLVIFALLLSGLVAAISTSVGAVPEEETRASTYNEDGDETRSFQNAFELQSGDVYSGSLNRVDDRGDYFKIDAVPQDVLNVHLYITGHDGINQWVPPDDAPPSPGLPTGIFRTYLYTGLSLAERTTPIDGAFNFFFTRHYVLNMCAPVPNTNAYYINVSIDWFMTPNNFTWEYRLDLDITQARVITNGNAVNDVVDMDLRDTHWFRLTAKFEDEVNGSVEVRNFNSGDPTERDMNIWIFPDDLGGYPFSYPWDWSAAPNEPIEPIDLLSTYNGDYFIKVRAMNHTNNLPVTYRLEMYNHQIPEFPDTGVPNMYFDR